MSVTKLFSKIYTRIPYYLSEKEIIGFEVNEWKKVPIESSKTLIPIPKKKEIECYVIHDVRLYNAPDAIHIEEYKKNIDYDAYGLLKKVWMKTNNRRFDDKYKSGIQMIFLEAD